MLYLYLYLSIYDILCMLVRRFPPLQTAWRPMAVPEMFICVAAAQGVCERKSPSGVQNRVGSLEMEIH